MSTHKCLLIFVLVVSASGHLHEEFHESSRHNRDELLDPWHHVRESCRGELGLTKRELKDLDRNGGDIEDYTTCFAKHLGVLHHDGVVKKHVFLKIVKDLISKTLAEPLMNHCLHKVYHGEVPHPNKIYQFWTKFLLCVKSKLTPEMWDIMGGFAEPEYAPLDFCEESY